MNAICAPFGSGAISLIASLTGGDRPGQHGQRQCIVGNRRWVKTKEGFSVRRQSCSPLAEQAANPRALARASELHLSIAPCVRPPLFFESGDAAGKKELRSVSGDQARRVGFELLRVERKRFSRVCLDQPQPLWAILIVPRLYRHPFFPGRRTKPGRRGTQYTCRRETIAESEHVPTPGQRDPSRLSFLSKSISRCESGDAANPERLVTTTAAKRLGTIAWGPEGR